MGTLWHPFTDLSTAESPLVLARGEGAYVWDEQGRRYLDSTASLWYVNVGHGRAEIAEAAAAQMRTLAAYSIFGDTATRPALDLADRLAVIAPFGGATVFFTSGGSDSVDTAVKMVRAYWQVRGRPRRSTLIHRQHSYHGMHVGGTSLAGIDPNRAGLGALLPDTIQVPWDDADALASAIDDTGADRVAAFFCEPVIGAGGAFVPPPGYLARARAICRERGVLFVADEVVTGYGRIGGAWFASTRFGLDPDLVTSAKGLTSGYLPMGAVLVSPQVAEPFRDGTAGVWRHGYTYSGHATAAAAAMANLDLVEKEGLLEQATRLETSIAHALAPLESHPLVGEVRRGLGAIGGVQIAADVLAADPSVPSRAAVAARDHGVLSRAIAPGALQVSPPLITTDAQVAEIAAGLKAALDDVAAQG